MNVFIPFTKLRAKTFEAVPKAILIPLLDDFAYSRYFQQQWSIGETFINLEHDVVPSKEILESLQKCDQPLCVTGYKQENGKPEASYLGCVKISAEFITARKIKWNGIHWTQCDSQLWLSDLDYEKNGDNFCYHGEVLHLK